MLPLIAESIFCENEISVSMFVEALLGLAATDILLCGCPCAVTFADASAIARSLPKERDCSSKKGGYYENSARHL